MKNKTRKKNKKKKKKNSEARGSLVLLSQSVIPLYITLFYYLFGHLYRDGEREYYNIYIKEEEESAIFNLLHFYTYIYIYMIYYVQ